MSFISQNVCETFIAKASFEILAEMLGAKPCSNGISDRLRRKSDRNEIKCLII